MSKIVKHEAFLVLFVVRVWHVFTMKAFFFHAFLTLSIGSVLAWTLGHLSACSNLVGVFALCLFGKLWLFVPPVLVISNVITCSPSLISVDILSMIHITNVYYVDGIVHSCVDISWGISELDLKPYQPIHSRTSSLVLRFL